MAIPALLCIVGLPSQLPYKTSMKASFDKGKKYAKNPVDGNVNKECNLLHVTTKHALILLIYMLFVVCIPKKTAKFLSDLLFFSIILRQKCNRQLCDTTESKTDTP